MSVYLTHVEYVKYKRDTTEPALNKNIDLATFVGVATDAALHIASSMYNELIVRVVCVAYAGLINRIYKSKRMN